jgi:UDP-N-acetylglucosamine 2-epimerase (non-hydrolysing)
VKVCIALGTRPEIVKCAPLLWQLRKLGMDPLLVHTGQHYSANMDAAFFNDLDLEAPRYNLGLGGRPFGRQVSEMTRAMKAVFQSERPDVVITQGDTNSVLAGVLAAAKLGIRIAHVEAGLRSFDPAMPEELNRILADSMADELLAPTEKSRQNLLDEGHEDARICVTGNTVVDALHAILPRARARSTVLADLGLVSDGFVLVTLHRPELVDDELRLRGAVEGLARISAMGLSLVFPVHPRTRKQLTVFGLEGRLAGIKSLKLIEPQGYMDFLALESAARLMITDSGGLQEEACVLRVPCVTLRENTERPETVDIGANILAGYSPDALVASVRLQLQQERRWGDAFGDGRSAQRILARLGIQQEAVG